MNVISVQYGLEGNDDRLIDIFTIYLSTCTETTKHLSIGKWGYIQELIFALKLLKNSKLEYNHVFTILELQQSSVVKNVNIPWVFAE